MRLLGPKTVDLMISNHIGDLAVSLRGPGYGFGLGFSVLLDAGKSKEPLSPGSFGWGGAYCTYFFVDPVEELIGVFMTQMVPYRHIDVRGQFAVLASQAITESTKPIGGYRPVAPACRPTAVAQWMVALRGPRSASARDPAKRCAVQPLGGTGVEKSV